MSLALNRAVSLIAFLLTGGSQEGTFREPPVIASRHGELNVTLTAAEVAVNIGGTRVTAGVYDGSYIPPTLRVRPGDVIRLRLVNRLGDPTNLHLHGMAVSPGGNSDNVFMHGPAGGALDYEFRIPPGHAAGLYWYHPHPHEHSDDQVRGGMSGALIVDGLLDSIPALRGVNEHVLLLKDIQIQDGRVVHLGIGKGTVRTVNGLVNPTLVLHPGETQLWRIGNVGADLFYSLRLDGLSIYEVARDGHRLARAVSSGKLWLGPGARREVLVQAGQPGSFALRTDSIDTGPSGNQYAGTVLATVRVEGTPVTRVAIPERLLPVADLRGSITGRRTIVFSESEDGNTFFIDGRTFDPQRTDVRVKLGAVEVWTIRNESAELHNFHIHQTPFQVTAVNGVPERFLGYQDIVTVPARGEVQVTIPFTDPTIVGRFVFHCHLLAHEDHGMMATIEVTR